MELFWILGERTHIKSFNCACLARGKILNKSWLLISLYNLRQVTSSLSSYFLIQEMELIILNSEWLWRSNGISYLECLVNVWHVGAVYPTWCSKARVVLCVCSVDLYWADNLLYAGVSWSKRDQVPALKSLHFTGGGGGERVSRNKYMMILWDCDESNEGYGSGFLGVRAGWAVESQEKMWKVRGVSCLNSKGTNTWWGT